VNENIKHLRQIIENSIPAETTSGQPSPTLAEAQVVLDLLEADMREATEQVTNIKAMREDMANEIERLQVDSKPEIRGLLHTVVKWIMAGHMTPNDEAIVGMHADKKRAVAAKMGVRLAMGAWLSAAAKACHPHENCATPILDPNLSNLSAALSWLQSDADRSITISHGGEGGLWYVRMKDEGGESPSDGANQEITTAIGDAMCGMEAKP
jgi:hypothetical protein